jgi:hypothetical protein
MTTNLMALIGDHLLTVVAEAEDNFWRQVARKKRANSLYRSLTVREQLSRVREGLAPICVSYTVSSGDAGPAAAEAPPQRACVWMSRHGPASKTLDLTMQQLEDSEEELKAAMMGMARTRVALAEAEAAYAEVLLKLVVVRGF